MTAYLLHPCELGLPLEGETVVGRAERPEAVRVIRDHHVEGVDSASCRARAGWRAGRILRRRSSRNTPVGQLVDTLFALVSPTGRCTAVLVGGSGKAARGIVALRTKRALVQLARTFI